MIRTIGYLAAAVVLWTVRESLRPRVTTPQRESCPLCGAPATTGAHESGVYCAGHEGLYRAAGQQRIQS